MDITSQGTGVIHPGRDQVLKAMDTRAEVVVRDQILGQSSKPVLFIKNMAHHLVGVDLGFLDSLTHVFLIRNPREMIPSLMEILPDPSILDTAYKMEYKLYTYLTNRGIRPLIIDATELCNFPETTLRRICAFCKIPFQQSMLRWQSGPLGGEGVWAKYWYHRVRETTGFQPYQAKKGRTIPDKIEDLVEECYGYYLALYEQRLSQTSGPSQGNIPAMAGS